MKHLSSITGSRSLFRIGRLALFLALVGLVLPELASARRLSSKDLRKLGFAGIYRGTVSGRVTYRLNNLPPLGLDQSRIVNTNLVERIPIRRTFRVPGPLGLIGVGQSTFTLTHFPAQGNDRRVTIRGTYSGSSTNTLYPTRIMIGSGNKRISIAKRGRKNPRFIMTHATFLHERRDDGVSYSIWQGRGRLEK